MIVELKVRLTQPDLETKLDLLEEAEATEEPVKLVLSDGLEIVLHVYELIYSWRENSDGLLQ